MPRPEAQRHHQRNTHSVTHPTTPSLPTAPPTPPLSLLHCPTQHKSESIWRIVTSAPGGRQDDQSHQREATKHIVNHTVHTLHLKKTGRRNAARGTRAGPTPPGFHNNASKIEQTLTNGDDTRARSGDAAAWTARKVLHPHSPLALSPRPATRAVGARTQRAWAPTPTQHDP